MGVSEQNSKILYGNRQNGANIQNCLRHRNILHSGRGKMADEKRRRSSQWLVLGGSYIAMRLFCLCWILFFITWHCSQNRAVFTMSASNHDKRRLVQFVRAGPQFIIEYIEPCKSEMSKHNLCIHYEKHHQETLFGSFFCNNACGYALYCVYPQLSVMGFFC